MITVLRPGSFTTVQDLGRVGLGHLGVSQAGAADAFSLKVANRLVGNADGVTALEMTGEGAKLRFETEAHVALTGGTLEASIDGQPLPLHQTLTVPAGAILDCGRISSGCRCYLAVAGGILTPLILGSSATDTLSGLGPQPLTEGAQLTLGPPPTAAASAMAGAYLRSPPHYGVQATLRVLAGPQREGFTAEAHARFASSVYRVLAKSDRTGVRLEGPPLPATLEGELPSQGVVEGALQVPPSGQPIALLANHGATGGYPVIAVVISADLGALAQLAPGTEVRFLEVGRSEALRCLHEQEQRLERDIVSADAGLLAARALMLLAERHVSLKQAAVNDGERRIRIRRGN